MGRKGRTYDTAQSQVVRDLIEDGYTFHHGAWHPPKRRPVPWFQRPREIRVVDPMTGREVTPSMIILTYEARRMIHAACIHNSNLEVGGFGHTFLNDNGDIVVDDIYIPPQIVEAAHTNIVGPAEAGADKFDDEGNRIPFGLEAAFLHFQGRGESWSDWRLWWHSHVDMGTGPSGTDRGTLEGIAKQLDWAIGIVANKKGEMHPWMVANMAGFPTLTQDNFDTIVLPHPLPDAEQRVNEMMQHVERKTYAPANNSQWRGQNGGNPNARTGGTVGANAGAVGKPSSPVIHLNRPGKSDVLDLSDEDFAKWLDEEDAPALLTAGKGGDAE